MTETESTISLKLLIDTHGQRVLFVEAGKDFVDFLFGILPLPMGAVISLLREKETAGSSANLYRSMENLNESYLQPNLSKETFFKPFVWAGPLLGLRDESVSRELDESVSNELYWCDECQSHASDAPDTGCPDCGETMVATLSFLSRCEGGIVKGRCEGGIVKGVVTYMVMDDLVVKPMSTISSITLLNKFNVKDVGALQEKVVHFGNDEVVKLLEASLRSKKVLTDVFLDGIK